MRMLIKSAAQYRTSFIMQTLAQFVMAAGEFLAVVVLMARFTTLGQWTAEEIMLFWGVMQLTFAFCEFLGRGISNFSYYVGSGEFDTMLLRPKPLLVQMICARSDPRRAGVIVVGLAAIVAASLRLHLVWTVQKAVLLLLACTGTFFLLMGLFLIEATFSFFSVRSIEMVNVLTYGGRSACEYPVDVYPKPLRLLFTFVAPFALCMHLPVSHLLGKPLFDLPMWCVYLAPMAGPVFFVLMACVWRFFGAQHYRSTGT